MRVLIVAVFILSSVCLLKLEAQSDKRIGTITNLNYKFSAVKPWTVNLSLESRQIFREYAWNEKIWSAYRYERTDFTTLVGSRIGFNAHADLGFMLRRTAEHWVHRSIQQYAWVTKYRIWRIGHRFRTDQTFREGRLPSFRLRYRISGDMPLSGEKLDQREWYLKWSNEHVPKIQGKDLSYEMRLGFAFGHYFSDNNKLEIGVDTRFGDYGLDVKDEQYWLSAAWFISM